LSSGETGEQGELVGGFRVLSTLYVTIDKSASPGISNTSKDSIAITGQGGRP
jgi:hypothetical protein